MYYYTTKKNPFTETRLSLLSRELVNDQSSVSSCNQNPGSHAKHKDKLGKTLYCVDSGVKVCVTNTVQCSERNKVVYRGSRALTGKNTNT